MNENSSSIFKKAKSNFALAFYGLQKDKRKALEAVYAYCRILDDTVDEISDPEKAKEALKNWRSALIEGNRNGNKIPGEIASDLEWSISRFSLQESDLIWILDGVEKDTYKTRYDTFEELLSYCDAVASAVGFCCISIFGVDRSVAKNYVYGTGRALQLTNILRDVREDAQRNRIYIPREIYEAFDLTENDFLSSRYDDRFQKMMRAFSQKIEEQYNLAETFSKNLPMEQIWPAEIMRKTYKGLFRKIQSKQYDVFSERIRLGRAHKAWIAISQPRQ